ncbi:MAG: efflux RND transporter permease subunit [Pseudomonadota bacterium]
MKLCNFCIKRPAFTTVLSLLIIAIGLICYQKLSVRYLPKITVPIITVSTDYPGASSQIVESQVTNLLEDAMSGLSGLKFMTSTSINGNSQIMLTFLPKTGINSATADIRANIAKVVDQLPPGTKMPVVSKLDANTQPILFFSYADDNKSIGALTNYVRQFIVPQFQASSGVAKVKLWSSHYYALRIWLNPTEMAARGVTVSDITQVLQHQNIAVPTGTIKGKELAYTVVADLKLHRPAQFGNLLIKDTNNHVVRLKDVARIEVGTEHRTTDTEMRYFSINGKQGVAIGLIPEAGANNLQMTDLALKLAHKIAAGLPDGMTQNIVYNQSDFTKAALHSVFEAIFEAFILVVLVIGLFLGSIRAAIIPIVTVPICLIGSFAVIYFLGYSINSITLLALVLAIGLVVDDAIVMLENIARFTEKGIAPLQAAFKGSKQIAFAIVAMTITLAGVYAPVGFSSGISGTFFKEFAFTLLGAVLISGFVALTLSPMMCATMLKTTTQNRYHQWLEKLFNHLQIAYRQILHYLLKRALRVLTVIVALIAIGVLTFFSLSKELAPPMNMPIINVFVKTAPQDSYAKIHSFIPKFESTLNHTPEVQQYIMQNWNRQFFYSMTSLKPDQIKNSHKIAQRLQNELDNIPGTTATISVAPPPLTWYLPSSQPGSIQMNVMTSSSYLRLHQIMHDLVTAVKKDQRFINPDTALKWNTRQLNIEVNRDLVADLNVPISAVTDTLETMLGGKQVGKYEFGNQSFDVIMQLSDQDLKTSDILDQLYVHSNKHQMIPLQSLISTNITNAPPSLTHYNRLRSDTLTAKLAPGFSMGSAIHTLQTIAKQILPADTKISFSGSAEQYLESSNTMVWIFILALVFIYLILVAQFESFIDPLIILTCVPFAAFGALFALKLTGNSLNLYSEIGLVTLIGLIAKHGILITEFANQKLAEGKTVLEAIMEGASLRLRPILMTTSAMVLGALPLALAFGPGSENRHQIGWVIVGGLLFGTLISLIVVPMAYVLIQNIKRRF